MSPLGRIGYAVNISVVSGEKLKEYRVKITFECKESLYKWLCNVDEYVRQTPEWQHRTITSLDDVIALVLDQGFQYFYFDNPAFQAYDAALSGAEVLRDDDGAITGFYFPEKP
jgi:hypothetical protein